MNVCDIDRVFAGDYDYERFRTFIKLRDFLMFLKHHIYGSVHAIPTYRDQQLYDTRQQADHEVR